MYHAWWSVWPVGCCWLQKIARTTFKAKIHRTCKRKCEWLLSLLCYAVIVLTSLVSFMTVVPDSSEMHTSWDKQWAWSCEIDLNELQCMTWSHITVVSGGFQCWIMPRSRCWWKRSAMRPTQSRVHTTKVWRNWLRQSYSRSDDFPATRLAVTVGLLVTTFTFNHWVFPTCLVSPVYLVSAVCWCCFIVYHNWTFQGIFGIKSS